MDPLEPQESLLITVAGLAAELAGPRPPVLLDVRWSLAGPPGLGEYRAGHLPGAVFADLDRDLSGPAGPAGRHPLPAVARFETAMRRAGVGQAGSVVVYDGAESMAAARAWWLLRYFGHGHVRVLDGGYRAWVRAGQRVDTADVVPPAPGDFIARPGHMPVLDADGAAGLARKGLLLDARAPGRYRGETEPLDPAAGHIPGAVSAPTAENLSADGCFLPAGRLRERFGGLGAGGTGQPAGTAPGTGVAPADGDVSAAPPVGSYCGSGITAAHEVLALALAGIPAALYVGSWSNWSADPSRPVATGPEPG